MAGRVASAFCAFTVLVALAVSPLPSSATEPGANGVVTFVSVTTGNPEIFSMHTDGTGLVNLTQNPAVDLDPAYSPDGRRIAFSTNRDGNFEIYLMNTDGTGLTRLTNDPATDVTPSFSPDGTKIAFATNRDGNFEIYLMNTDGTGLVNLTKNPGDDADPTFSPDGKRIAFVTNRDGNLEIYTMKVDGAGQTNITNNPANDMQPDYSPLGNAIAFSSDRTGNAEIFTMRPSGAHQGDLTKNPAADTAPTFTPDGTHILFTTTRSGQALERPTQQQPNGRLAEMAPDGSGQHVFTDQGNSDPVVQPIHQSFSDPGIVEDWLNQMNKLLKEAITLTIAGGAGANKDRIDGRIDRIRKLKMMLIGEFPGGLLGHPFAFWYLRFKELDDKIRKALEDPSDKKAITDAKDLAREIAAAMKAGGATQQAIDAANEVADDLDKAARSSPPKNKEEREQVLVGLRGAKQIKLFTMTLFPNVFDSSFQYWYKKLEDLDLLLDQAEKKYKPADEQAQLGARDLLREARKLKDLIRDALRAANLIA